MRIFFLIGFVSLIIGIQRAWAYPEFIGYGYSTCITCHYNGLGSGPLNDYGRALWSAEIAAHPFYAKDMSDEDVANRSGFLGGTTLPTWFRPHIKYRGLQVETNPGGSSQQSKYFQMQADIGLTAQADPDGKLLAVLTWGNVVPPENYGLGEQKLHLLAREYFVRYQVAQTWWVYAGLLEKVYGIRNVDHTSYQRRYQSFEVKPDALHGMAQSEGVIVQTAKEKWELSGNYFVGNPYDSDEYKLKGVSAMGEYEIGEKKRLGASVFSAKSDLLKKQMAALHYRQGLSKGSALMLEYGIIQDEPLGQEKAVGSYNLIQTLVSLTRGYNLKASAERYNSEFKSSVPDQWRWTLGLLMFPIPRLELRADIVNQRDLSNQGTNDDTWQLQGQVHVSL